jgi:hypothetical protein
MYALQEKHSALALRLMKVHKAKVHFPEHLPEYQPLMLALEEDYSDEVSFPLVKEIVRADPMCLSIKAYRDVTADNPILACGRYNKPRCIDYLLSNGLAGAAELCVQPVHDLDAWFDGEKEISTGTCAADATDHEYWDVLLSMVRHSDVPVLVPERRYKADGTLIWTSPSLYKAVVTASPPPPRALVILVKTKAKQQQASLSAALAAFAFVPPPAGEAGEQPKGVKEELPKLMPPEGETAITAAPTTTSASSTKAAPTTRAAPVLDSNAFEDTAKAIVTERQEKQKAKKKATKKKARAKKREAARAKEASAGAGKASDDSDSSDYDGTDEEEDEFEPGKEHLIDSRNAPDLTVMLAARRAARAKEEAEQREKDAASGKGPKTGGV